MRRVVGGAWYNPPETLEDHLADTNYPPFMNSYGSIKRILQLAKDAQTPQRFTQDFLKSLLGYQSGSAEAIIPLMKRIGLLASDGTPTDLYKRFRNPAESSRAMAEAMRKGYHQIFALKENAYTLKREELDGLITQLTGLSKDHGTVRAIAKTFEALKGFASFDESASENRNSPEGALAVGTQEVGTLS